jgi:glucose/arabinose dehydrogenase
LSVIAATQAWGQIPELRLTPVSQDQIVTPTAITNAGDGSNRLFVTDQRGTVHIVQNGTTLASPFLDISSALVTERAGFDERGLLGLAFHPDYGTAGAQGEGKFYVYYSAPSPNAPGVPTDPVDHQSVIAEYRVSATDPNVADPSSERILMTIQQPQFNHNAGYLGFGSDGMLYITTGDGGSSNDNNVGHTGGGADRPSGILGNAQDRTKLLGKVLRIDTLGNNGPGGQYGIPADNPFVGVGNGVREEIFAYGLRNPWRATFDTVPGGEERLIVADVGQGRVEEINIVESGGNYGWRVKEGTFDFDAATTPDPVVPLQDPIAQYEHPGAGLGLLEVGLSVTGGVVYRGNEYPALQGSYIFGDWSTGFGSPVGTLLGLSEVAPGEFDSEIQVLSVEGGNPLAEYILAFGTDELGEIYVATKRVAAPSGVDPDTGLPTGSLYRIGIVPEPSAGLIGAVAALLSIASRRRRTI